MNGDVGLDIGGNLTSAVWQLSYTPMTLHMAAWPVGDGAEAPTIFSAERSAVTAAVLGVKGSGWHRTAFHQLIVARSFFSTHDPSAK
jgi:hypothetical protein